LSGGEGVDDSHDCDTDECTYANGTNEMIQKDGCNPMHCRGTVGVVAPCVCSDTHVQERLTHSDVLCQAVHA
jgi:hypothetical protein